MCLIGVLFILAGCQSDEKDEWTEDVEKTQAVEVFVPNGSEQIATMTSDQEIKDFINTLQLNTWKEIEKPPSDATEGVSYHLYQKDTIKFGESSEDKELNEVAKIVTYQDEPYITLDMEYFSLDFKIPEDIATELADRESWR